MENIKVEIPLDILQSLDPGQAMYHPDSKNYPNILVIKTEIGEYKLMKKKTRKLDHKKILKSKD